MRLARRSHLRTRFRSRPVSISIYKGAQGHKREYVLEYFDTPVSPMVISRSLRRDENISAAKSKLPVQRLTRSHSGCTLNRGRERNSPKEAIMKSWLVAALFILAASGARADCPNIITARSGIPGRSAEWTTTYDMKNGTFEARHVSGNRITGNVRGTCTDQAVMLEEFNTSNNNDGSCQLNRDGVKRFSGQCLPRGFEMRVNGF